MRLTVFSNCDEYGVYKFVNLIVTDLNPADTGSISEKVKSNLSPSTTEHEPTVKPAVSTMHSGGFNLSKVL